jgi:hypothetical protein
MTAITRFIISSILGFIGFQTPVENDLVKNVTSPCFEKGISVTPLLTEDCEI